MDAEDVTRNPDSFLQFTKAADLQKALQDAAAQEPHSPLKRVQYQGKDSSDTRKETGLSEKEINKTAKTQSSHRRRSQLDPQAGGHEVDARLQSRKD